MNEQQLAAHRLNVEAERQAAEHASSFLNCAPKFWDEYRKMPGARRRRSLVAIFNRFPNARLPVNNRYQANTVDPDLRYLLKAGVLVRIREGGGSQHPLNRKSNKRQTYLVLASQITGAA